MVDIIIKLKSGKEFIYTREDAKEVYEELKEIFEYDDTWFDKLFDCSTDF